MSTIRERGKNGRKSEVGNIVVNKKNQAPKKETAASNFRSLPLGALVIVVFGIRLFNAFTNKTFFQADEFFQSLEPAHQLVFGYGYITWEWQEKLRSSIHPLIFACGYQLIKMLKFSQSMETKLVYSTPKIIGATVATISEIYLYKFVQIYTNDEVLSRTALILSIANPFNWFMITRSFSNNLEMMLTTMALRYWPWNAKYTEKVSHTILPYFLGVLSCIVRPTNSILWVSIGIWTISNASNLMDKLTIIFKASFATILAFTLSSVLDYIYYQELTFPVYNFIEFNIIKNLSRFYGVAPWHFYLFQAIPLMTMTYLPILLYYIWMDKFKSLFTKVSLIVIALFSAIGHKEIRFIYPLQPIITLCIASSVMKLSAKYHHKMRQQRIIFSGVLIANFCLAFFFTQIHERGAIDVVNYLREDSNVTSFGFLTPCHSTPWQSNIHSPNLNNNSWFLTCHPPLHFNVNDDITSYRDESDQFYDDPARFLQTHFPALDVPIDAGTFKDENQGTTTTLYAWPSRLIIFEPLEDLINKELSGKYEECHRFFNSYFHWDSRRSGDIIVYCPLSASD